MAIDRAQFARDYFAAWERHDAEHVASLFSDDATYTDGTGHRVGIDAIRPVVMQQIAAITEVHPTFRTIAVDGCTVVVERREDVVFNGASLVVEGVVVMDVTDDGRITRFRDYYDPTAIRRG